MIFGFLASLASTAWLAAKLVSGAPASTTNTRTEHMEHSSEEIKEALVDSWVRSNDIDLFSPRSQREPLAALLDRLRNRLGLQAVQGIGCRDEHLPELAVAIGGECTGQAAPPGAQRPFWLLPEPRGLRLRDGRLHWRGALQLLYGPERIEDNWWREAVSRDYYIATGRGGQHYWVFRDRLAGQWYLHGIFA